VEEQPIVDSAVLLVHIRKWGRGSKRYLETDEDGRGLAHLPFAHGGKERISQRLAVIVVVSLYKRRWHWHTGSDMRSVHRLLSVAVDSWVVEGNACCC